MHTLTLFKPHVLQLKLLYAKRFALLFSTHSAAVYAYQGAIVAYLWNARTRALVSLLTGLGSMTGSIFIGFLLDKIPFSRRTRSFIGCGVVVILNIIIWSGGLGFQVQFSRETVKDKWDWTTGAGVGPIILIMACE